MENQRIRLALPKGSLNGIGRGNTESLLIDAGYDVLGYTPGSERSEHLAIGNDQEIVLSLVNPKNAPRDLSRGLADIAIIGQDWVDEMTGIAGPLIKLEDLRFGEVTVVFAMPTERAALGLTEYFLSNTGHENAEYPIIVYTEYVALTKERFVENEGYRRRFGDRSPVVEHGTLREGQNELVQIINSEGATEEYIRKGFPIVDNVQSGNTLARAGGTVVDVLMVSRAGLYARPGLEDDLWAWEKARDIKNALQGVVEASTHYDVKFNIVMAQLEPVLGYIQKNHLALNGPTVSSILAPDASIRGYAVNIIVPIDRYPQVSADLKTHYQASGIVQDHIRQLIR